MKRADRSNKDGQFHGPGSRKGKKPGGEVIPSPGLVRRDGGKNYQTRQVRGGRERKGRNHKKKFKAKKKTLHQTGGGATGRSAETNCVRSERKRKIGEKKFGGYKWGDKKQHLTRRKGS